MLLSNIEYIFLRFIRKFVFSDNCLIKFGKFIPYYLTNQNQRNPLFVINEYEKYLKLKEIFFQDKVILEIGSGATNSTGYALSVKGGEKIFLNDPYVFFNKRNDRKLLNNLTKIYNVAGSVIGEKVIRINAIKDLDDNSIDLILSSSVIEHVIDPETLFYELKRVLKPDGNMLHLIDYRDHFFKYPYHFLQFNKSTWDKWLNPGDLPRFRLYDHIKILNKLNLSFEILSKKIDEIEYHKILPFISNDFNKEDPNNSVIESALFITNI